MCGLIGVLMPSGAVDWARAAGALARIAHRGPDGQAMIGIDAQGNAVAAGQAARIGLGFARLSILDLTHAADQPMRCPVTGNIIVFNGEIYNFLELRAELEQRGHTFRTQGDTEVILASYREWGVEAFARFNGMWAMALYDAARGDLLLCRDRMGVKPLYTAQGGGQLVFASEIRAVTHLLGRMPSVNDAMVFDFLAGVATDHQDDTMFECIVQVPAGCFWRVDRDGAITRHSYHTWPEGTNPRHTPAQLKELFTDAVRLRLRSDAPTVSLLSGGLDSSVVTWVAATQNRETPRTKFVGAYTYGYSDARYAEHDEIDRAKALIAALPEPTQHTLLRTDPVPSLDELLAMTVTQELPTTTPSVIASWRLYQHIRAQGIKVVISGEGADELFAGYTRRFMPLLARDALKQGHLQEVMALLRSPNLSLTGLMNRLAWDLPAGILASLLRKFRPNIATLTPAFWQHNRTRFEAMMRARAAPLADQLRQGVIHTAMPEILRYSDRNSMGASVEVRLPFMDYRMVEFALTTPLTAMISAHGGKQILRQAFRSTLPAAVLAQPKTHGFGNAEQHQVLKLALTPLLERTPQQAWDYIDRATFTAQLAAPHAHPMLWLPVSFLLWMTARHEGRL